MKKYFITGAGTGVGKTVFTSALAYQLQQKGKQVRALKPIISGFEQADAGSSDSGVLLAAQGLSASPQNIDAISPWRFAAPLSPDMAAEDECKAIDFEQLVAFCGSQTNAEYLLIEGVGGIMVPLNMRHTVLDWAVTLGFPVILVTGSYLGSLSHTLTAAQTIISAGLNLHTVVISESEYSAAPLDRIELTLRRFLPDTTQITQIARLDSSSDLWKYVPDHLQSLFI
jgi:dethiobiotin synthetase